MATPLEKVTAAPVDIRLAGKTYRMAPLTDKDVAELDNFARGWIIRMALDALPPDAPDDIKRITMEAAVRVAAGTTWLRGKGQEMMNSVAGWARILWQGLRKNHRDLTPEKIAEMLTDPVTLEEATEAWRRLNLEAKGATGSGADEKKAEAGALTEASKTP